jgi:hypothetical protein
MFLERILDAIQTLLRQAELMIYRPESGSVSVELLQDLATRLLKQLAG